MVWELPLILDARKTKGMNADFRTTTNKPNASVEVCKVVEGRRLDTWTIDWRCITVALHEMEA